ncbi:MAG: hypothetical protein GF401_04480 [Chitinivibrionales bacterium]|nr:hypothetical protein [Chitinivibrionales bacterium]
MLCYSSLKKGGRFNIIVCFMAIGWVLFILIDTLMGVTRSGYTIRMNKNIKHIYKLLNFFKTKILLALLVINAILAISTLMISKKNAAQ